MRALSFRLAALPGLALAAAGCGRIPDQAAAPQSHPGARVITEAQIQQSGATSAWQALEYTVPFYRFDLNGTVRHRGQQSILLHDRPRILVDGVDLTEFGVLTKMPASDLTSIEILGATDATTYYGTNSASGVILLHTKSSGT